MNITKTYLAFVAILAALGLAATATASTVPVTNPPTYWTRSGGEYHALNGTCSASAGQGTLAPITLTCDPGESGSISYRLKHEPGTAVRTNLSGDGITGMSVNTVDGTWRVSIQVGQGSTTITNLSSYSSN